MKIFLIGNSFSNNATRFLSELAAESGHEMTIGRAEVGGCSLQRHWNAVQDAERGDGIGEGAMYDGSTLRQLLGDGNWDLVTLQQASLLSSNLSSYQPYANSLRDFVRNLCPRAEIVLHQTWAYREDSQLFGEIGDGKRAQSREEMWQKSRAAYHAIAGEWGARIIPVGDAFQRVATDETFAFVPDKTTDLSALQFPDLPQEKNSLHVGYQWTEERQLWSDPNHASDAGCYLGSCVWHGFLFGESPEKLRFAPETISADFAAHLRAVAASVLADR